MSITSATHRCRTCGALWRLNDPDPSQPNGSPLRRDASWTLVSTTGCGPCCDVVPMAGQMEPLPIEGIKP